MTNIARALSYKWPGESWTLRGDGYEDLEWNGSATKPTLAEIEAADLEYDQNELYKERRKNEYPPIEEQLDLIYDDGLDGWRKEIKKIKDKHPKPVRA